MKIETFKKRFGDNALQIPKGFDGIDSKMMKAKNGKMYMIHFNSKGLPIAKEIKLKNVDILESFRDRFEFTNNDLKWKNHMDRQKIPAKDSKTIHEKWFSHRDDLTGEHKWGDAGQIICALLFFGVWAIDSFYLRYTTQLNGSPLPVRV